METITEETKTDWKNGLKDITENIGEKWFERRRHNGKYGGIGEFVKTQVEDIRKIVKEKNGSVSDEVNEVLDTYEMEQTETNRKLEGLYEEVNGYEDFIDDCIERLQEDITKILEK